MGGLAGQGLGTKEKKPNFPEGYPPQKGLAPHERLGP